MRSFSFNGLDELKLKLNSKDEYTDLTESNVSEVKVDSNKLLIEIQNIINTKVSLYECHEEYEFRDSSRIAEEYLSEREEVNKIKIDNLIYDFKIDKV